MSAGGVGRARAVAAHPLSIWLAFALVHLGLGWLGAVSPERPFNDVTGAYRQWATEAMLGGPVVGVDVPWVYPAAALVPILAAAALGVENYLLGWLLLVALLDVAALSMLLARRPRPIAAAWWWIGFLALLGPVAIGRLEAVTVPIALFGALLAARTPAIAMALLTLAAWIKVWPAALAAALFVAGPLRLRQAASAVGVSLAVLAVPLALGAGATAFGFLETQAARGLQIESPLATVPLWRMALGGDAAVAYDTGILTFQITGAGSELALALSTPVTVAILAAVLALGGYALRGALAPGGAGRAAVLPPLALGLVTALIVANKVGSPQFAAWLVVPVLWGLLTASARFRLPATLALVVAVLTQLVYPYFYDALVEAEPWMLVVIGLRNLLYLALLLWAAAALWSLGAGRDRLGATARGKTEIEE